MSQHPLAVRLASASPRRLTLLAAAGVRCCLCPAHADEHWPHDRPPGEAALAVAEDKLRAAQFIWAPPPGEVTAAVPWLAADTAVVVDGDVLGKPRDADDARAMLRRLSGRTHEVVTGFVVGLGEETVHRQAVVTRVTMRPFGERELSAYVAGGESMDKAGAYAVQGAGGALVHQLTGSLSNVVGLPLHEVLQALSAVQHLVQRQALSAVRRG